MGRSRCPPPGTSSAAGATPGYDTLPEKLAFDLCVPARPVGSCIICGKHDSLRMHEPGVRGNLLCSTGDADAESPFSSASNPLFDEQLAARHGSALRSPDNGMLCQDDNQAGGDVLQLRRCDLTLLQDFVPAAAVTRVETCRTHPSVLPHTGFSGVM